MPEPIDRDALWDELNGPNPPALSEALGAAFYAADHPYPGLAPAATARLNQVWDDGQQAWLSLSSVAHLVTVENTSPYIQLDRPDVTLSQIEGLLP